MDFFGQGPANVKQKPSIPAKLVDISKDVAWLEHEKADLLATVDRQASSIRDLQQIRDLQRQSPKLALYIYIDGTIQIKPPMVEPGENGPRAIRHYRQERFAGGHVDFGRYATWREEFQLVYETRTHYVYEQIA